MFLTNPILNALNGANVYSNIIEGERTFIGYILNWLRLIGTGLALIMLTYIGIRYIISEPPKRAELKKSLNNYFIGAAVFIGATNIIYYLGQLIEYILVDFII